MKRKKTPKTPKRRLVYEGPVGRCPDCGKGTEVRLGSPLNQPSTVAWTVPADVLATLYREVVVRIKELKDGKLYVTDPSEYDGTRRSKFFFVDAHGGIAGPFGQRGLKVFLGTEFGSTLVEDVNIYVVTTTSRALAVIRESPFARDPEPAPPVDGSVGMF
jgi:hypothetical protein